MACSVIKTLITEPNVCRCCLSTSGEWDMNTSYLTEDGNKIVYSEVLETCFGISFSNMEDINISRQVCELCITHIREVSAFRKQVLEAKKTFMEYYDNNIIKNENKPKINDDILQNITGSLSDDDTPLSELLEGCYTNGLVKEIVSKRIENKAEVTTVQHRPQSVKHISERKKVKLTCETVLKGTNACPFRHHKSWFQCFYCTEDFIKIDELREHNLKNHKTIDDELKKLKRYPRSLQIEITELKCVYCDLILPDIELMCRHFGEQHEKIVYKECLVDYKVNASPYCCHICEKQYHVFRNLTTHLNVHYANCVCDVCGKSFLNTKRLKVHTRTHEIGQYPCTKCGKILKTKLSKANHMSTHTKRILKCQICFQPMKHYNDRIKHMSDIHNITHTFKCLICDKEFKVKHYLATHMRQTHGNKSKKCVDCGMGFITNYGLKKHMLRHTGLKEFKCGICCKSYARSYTLKEHLRTHSEGT